MKAMLKLTCVVLCIAIGGCATTEDVREIVDGSNQAIISYHASREAAQVGAAGAQLDPEGDEVDWKRGVERIEVFIAAHPEETLTNRTLRIRQAVILMNARQINLARTVFAEVDCGSLEGSARDRAICEAQDPLLFWYGIVDATGTAELPATRAAMEKLAQVADELPEDFTTRRAFEQIRVRMANAGARLITDCPEMLTFLGEALQRYQRSFDRAARLTIQNWALDQDVEKEALASLRWFDYAPDAYRIARRTTNACAVDLTPDWIACINDNQMSCEGTVPN